MLILTRSLLSADRPTLGVLEVRRDHGHATFCTLELPWQNGVNAHDLSCVLPGEYKVYRRLAAETRHGYDVFELKNVPGRTNVQLHVGNYATDTDGCILVGTVPSVDNDYITGSRIAFARMMALLNDVDTEVIRIINPVLLT